MVAVVVVADNSCDGQRSSSASSSWSSSQVPLDLAQRGIERHDRAHVTPLLRAPCATRPARRRGYVRRIAARAVQGIRGRWGRGQATATAARAAAIATPDGSLDAALAAKATAGAEATATEGLAQKARSASITSRVRPANKTHGAPYSFLPLSLSFFLSFILFYSFLSQWLFFPLLDRHVFHSISLFIDLLISRFSVPLKN